MQFDYSISHVPDKFLYTTDALSRASIDEIVTEDCETEAMVQAVLSLFPGSNDHLEEYCKAQHADATCSKLIAFCRNGWPDKSKVIGDLSRYWRAIGELTVNDNLLLYDTRVVAPDFLRKRHLHKCTKAIRIFIAVAQEFCL